MVVDLFSLIMLSGFVLSRFCLYFMVDFGFFVVFRNGVFLVMLMFLFVVLIVICMGRNLLKVVVSLCIVVGCSSLLVLKCGMRCMLVLMGSFLLSLVIWKVLFVFFVYFMEVLLWVFWEWMMMVLVIMK